MSDELDELWEATQAGTFPNGTSFATGDQVPLRAIPPGDRDHLRRRGVFVRPEPRPAPAAPKRAPAPTHKRARPTADKAAAEE